MPRVVASVIAVALGAATAVAAASCGEDDAKLLAGNTAQEIRENLDTVQQLVDEGECVGAEDEALQVTIQVEGLKGIDPELKQALEDGAAKLNEVVDTCEEPEPTVEETVPQPSENAEKKAKEEQKDQEHEEEEREKEEEKAEKEREKEEEKEAEETPSLPPQSNGKAKGHEEAPPSESEGESGGIGPASETGEGG